MRFCLFLLVKKEFQNMQDFLLKNATLYMYVGTTQTQRTPRACHIGAVPALPKNHSHFFFSFSSFPASLHNPY